MTDRSLFPAVLVLAAALSACGGCGDDRETRRIDLGLRRPPQETPPEPPPNALPAAPAGDEIADSGDREGGEPSAATGESAEEPGGPATGDRRSEAPAETGSAAAGAGASSPRPP